MLKIGNAQFPSLLSWFHVLLPPASAVLKSQIKSLNNLPLGTMGVTL